jgi:hypothetical protein
MMVAAMLCPTIYMPSQLAKLLIPPVSSQGKVMAPVGDTGGVVGEEPACGMRSGPRRGPGSKELLWRLHGKVPSGA